VSSSDTAFAIFQIESEHVDNVQQETRKAKMVKVCMYVWLVAPFVD